MSKLCEISYIKELTRKYQFSFKKSLGQNFLISPHVPFEIAQNANIDSDTCVLEVGPGIGTLSYELCSIAKSVVAVELDRHLPELLSETMAEHKNFTVVGGDILKCNIPQIVHYNFGDAKNVVACANLPYYITTPAVTALIESKCFKSITVMVQKEVAKRICAKEDTSDYGAFTVFIKYFADASIVLNVPAGCFMPAPKVDSAVVRLDIRQTPPSHIDDEKMFFKVARAAFAQRRKTLLNCLCAAFSDVDKPKMTEILALAQINPQIRGEALIFSQLAHLSNVIYKEL